LACAAEALTPFWWRDASLLQAELDAHGSFAAAGRTHQVAASTLKSAWSEHGLPPRPRGALRPAVTLADPLNEPLLKLAAHLVKACGTGKAKLVSGRREPHDGLERIFFIGDAHVPYHSREGFAIWLKACRDFKPTLVVQMGDFVDCFSVSSYSKDPGRALGLDKEIEAARDALDEIEKASPGARRIYIAGNHEDGCNGICRTRRRSFST
jgi:hypothetical protein